MRPSASAVSFIAASVLSAADAMETYYIVTTGIGYEANPQLSIINGYPWLSFVFAIASIFAFYVLYRLKLSIIIKYLAIARAIIVVNNASIILRGYELIEPSLYWNVIVYLLLIPMAIELARSFALQFKKPRIH